MDTRKVKDSVKSSHFGVTLQRSLLRTAVAPDMGVAHSRVNSSSFTFLVCTSDYSDQCPGIESGLTQHSIGVHINHCTTRFAQMVMTVCQTQGRVRKFTIDVNQTSVILELVNVSVHAVLVTPVPVTAHSCHIGSSANKSLCCEQSVT
eukprot:1043545-Amphidinium_carterae.3